MVSNYFYLSANFLRLAHESAVEIVNSTNPAFVTSESPVSNSEFNQAIRWTNHSVGIAALFCFYHGIELIMKCLILAKQSDAKGHCLTRLLNIFQKHYPDSLINPELNKHIKSLDGNSPLLNFLTQNKIGIDNWYEALKYPEMMDKTVIDHFSLKYNGVTGIEYWKSIVTASANIHNHSKTLLDLSATICKQ